MSFSELRSLIQGLIPDLAVVALISFVYALTEVVVLTNIHDPLYRWLTFFLVTALFSNVLARHISSIAKRI